MKESAPPQESATFAVLHTVIYAIATPLLVASLAGWPGVIGGWAGVVAGVVVGLTSQSSNVRTVVLAGAGLLAFLLGLYCEELLAGHTLLASLFGPTRMLNVVQSVTFFLLIGGGVAVLRTLGSRFPTFGILEPIAVSALAVRLFVGHRDLQLGEPRFLADWAFGRGIDPMVVIAALGAVTLFVALLMLLREKKISRGLSAAVVLALVSGGVFLWGRDVPPPKDPPPPKRGTKQKQSAGKPGPKKSGKGTSGRSRRPPDRLGFKPPDNKNKNKPRPMFVVVFRDDYAPPSGQYYIRTAASSQFNGTRLVGATAPGADLEVPREFPTGPKTFDLTKADPRLVVNVPTTVNILAPQSRPPALVTAAKMKPRTNPNPALFRRSYDVVSRSINVPFSKLLSLKAGNPKWSAALRKHYLKGPSDPRYKKLASQIIARLNAQHQHQESPLFKALVVRRWIEKNIVYSTRYNYSGVGDPTAAFLFGRRKGYCVYIAHAMVYLLRSLGVPARVSSGYVAPSRRRGRGSSLLLQETDAHQWAEIYLQRVGWLIIDAAPERSEDPKPPGVNRETQRLLGEQQTVKRRPRRSDGGPSKPFSWYLLWLLLAAASAILLLFSVKLWRRLIPRWVTEEDLYRVGYRALLDRLAEIGITRQFGETRESFAARVGELSPCFGEATRAHLRGALLPQSKPLPAERWRNWTTTLERDVAGTYSLPRRLLGLLDPFSWIRVR